MRHTVCTASFVAALFLLSGIGRAQVSAAKQLFQIGKFDRTSDEFTRTNPAGAHRFEVGRDGDLQWFALQPAKTSASDVEHSQTISFNVGPMVDSYGYHLRVALLIESQNIPALEVSVNGKTGVFYPQPSLDYELGDRIAQNDPAYSHADISYDLPPALFHTGRNEIMLTAAPVSDAAPDASLTFDALDLTGLSAKPTHQNAPVVLPTIFFTRDGARLQETVDVLLDSAALQDHVIEPLTLSVGGKPYGSTRTGSHAFGQDKFEFSVPEFEAETLAEVSWQSNGGRRTVKQRISPCKKWTLMLVPHIHLDVGFTDYQAKVAAVQSRVIDEAMSFSIQHPDFKFSIDGSWNLEQFLNTRTEDEKAKLVEAIRERRIFVPAQYANLLTGFAGTETLIRSLYYSANFSRRYGTPFDYANITDVPSYSWSYASVLASAGIHTFAAGSNNHRAPVLFQGRLNERSPFLWAGPDKQKVLMWYSRHYMQMQFLFGVPPVLSAGHDMLPLFLKQYASKTYKSDVALIFGTQVENTDLFPQQAELVDRWNERYAYPRLQYSGFKGALDQIEQQFGKDLETISGDGGPYWELGIGADAGYIGVERSNETLGLSAEKLATLSSLVDRRVATPKAELDAMWTNMILMDEHTWSAWNSVIDPTGDETVDQLAVKDAFATHAQAQASAVAQLSMATLADSISAKQHDLVVFNTLNWKRSAVVNLDLNKGDEILDRSTKQTVPYEVTLEGNKIRKVRFLAAAVPATGYRVFEIRAAAASPAGPSKIIGNVIESPFYRLELDPASGAVKSILDKQANREMVDASSPYRFGQYLYVTGGDRLPNGTMLQSWYRPTPARSISMSSMGKVVSLQKTPSGAVAILESSAPNTPHIKSEIRLFDGEKKIEFVEDFDKNDVTADEAVYFAFPFAMTKPTFRYEIQTGTVDPSKDMYPGASHNWFSVQHWMGVEQDGAAGVVMPLDAPLATFGDIDRGDWPQTFEGRKGTLFSYVMNNYWEDNYRGGQGGHFRFRYVVTSAAALDEGVLSKRGWEEATPLEANMVTSQDKALFTARSYSGESASFLDTSDDKVLLQTWKTAEDGRGTILRFVDLGGGTREVEVRSDLLHLKEAVQTDSVERDKTALQVEGEHAFRFTLHPHEIVTIRAVER